MYIDVCMYIFSSDDGTDAFFNGKELLDIQYRHQNKRRHLTPITIIK